MQWLISNLSAFFHPGGIILTNFAVVFVIFLLKYKSAISRILFSLAGIVNILSFAHFLGTFQKPFVIEFGNFLAPYGIVFYITKFGLLISLIFSALFFLISYFYIFERQKPAYFYGIILLHFTAGLGLLFTTDFFNFFVFFEIFSISTFAYVATSMGEKSNFGGVVKLTISGSIAGVFILLAIALIYLSTGSVNMADFSNRIFSIDTPIRNIIFLLFVLGLSVELKLFPLNFWVKGVYGDSEVLTLGILSGFSGMLLLTVFIKLYFLVFIGIGVRLLYIVGLITLYLGVLSALVERNIKNILGFSTVAQIGLILLVVSYRGQPTTRFALYHLVVVAIIEIIAFIVLSSLRVKNYDLKEFTAFYYKKPRIAGILGLLFILYAGFPPSPLFWTKLGIIFSLFNASHYIGAVLVLGAIGIEIAYLFKILREIFSDVSVNYIEEKFRLRGYLAGLLVLLIILMGLMPHKIYNFFGISYGDVFMRTTFIKTVLRGMLW